MSPFHKYDDIFNLTSDFKFKWEKQQELLLARLTKMCVVCVYKNREVSKIYFVCKLIS